MPNQTHRQNAANARNTAFSYKGTQTDVRQIAHELGVSYVIEGSVRRSGARIRVAVTLIHAKMGATLWSQTWNREISDVFELQDELTRAIVNAITPEMGANERALSLRKATDSLTAWELSQRGMAELYSYTADSYQRAFKLFHAAANADPNFALPRAQLARWHSAIVVIGRSSDPVVDLMKGIEHANAAIKLDDRLEDGHIAMGSILGMMRREVEAFQAPWGFHFMLASARWNRDPENGYLAAQADIEAACSFPQVEYFPLFVGAYLYVRLGDLDRAKHFLGRALEKRPDLTREKWRTAFPFPTWPKMVSRLEKELEVLVSLGLPSN